MKKNARVSCAIVLCLIPALWASSPARALDSSDLLFHLSFEDGLNPELARGGSRPAVEPQDTERRLVDGVIGRGYLFAGKGSTIEYYAGEQGPRACAEMYGAKANLFGDSGTVSYWLRLLPNTHNQHHDFIRFGAAAAYRDLYSVYYFNYADKQGQMYNTKTLDNAWMHFAATWRAGEFRTYVNGLPWGAVRGGGAMSQTPERFIVAAEGKISAAFQKQDFEDDTVIDEVQVFGRPLADEEIRSLYERAHTIGRRCTGAAFTPVDDKPERAYAGHAISAALVPSPIKADGDLSEWSGVPAHGGFIERRVGVLDNDPGVIYAACDAANLYLAFYCPVDQSIQNDPTHIRYPTGEFKASPLDRDGDVHADDYVEFVLKGRDEHEYRFAVNARGSLLDSRDGDRAWNANLAWTGRSDLKDWTVELVIPLAELGLSLGDTLDFNVIRSWKLFKSSQNVLCADERSQPAPGKLTLGGSAAASIEGLGKPWQGDLAVAGSITGPPGEYTVKAHAKGLGQEFAEEKKVSVGSGIAPFEVARRLEKPGDLAMVIEVLDPSGKSILVRTIPFVYVAASKTELVDYPGWGRLDVVVAPVTPRDAHATVSLLRGNKPLSTQDIARFDGPDEKARFDTRRLQAGNYVVLTRLYQGDALVGEDRQDFNKKPLPEWYHCKAGIIDGPPIPWTDVKVKGSAVKLLIKDISFDKTLFPARIISNGQSLLSGPVRIRVKRNGKEKVLTAGNFRFTKRTRRRADWVSTAKDGNLNIKVNGWIEFDGFTWMRLTLSGGTVEHLTLEIPLRKESATLKTLDGKGLLGDKPLSTSACGSWFGNEKAGIQYWWEDQRGWVLTGENVEVSKKLLRSWEYTRLPVAKKETVTVTPAREEVIISIPFIQGAVDLNKPRAIAFGWAITPTKPIRKDWRNIKLHKGIVYTTSYYSNARPNYPSAMPGETREYVENSLDSLKKMYDADIVLWYAFGPFMWIGAPEYADWWREWRVTSWQEVPPNPNSNEWGWACHESSGSDLFLWKLEKFMKEYPQRGVYVDCYFLMACDNEAHGCGYVDENGKRQMTVPLLATRRHYERLYNIVKATDPVYGWIRIHDWGPIMPVAAFCDENWSGEGLIGPIGNTPGKNYYGVVDLPYARVEFRNEQWGHFQNWLTEMAVWAGTDPKKREEWFARLVNPPRDGRRGDWIVPRMADYEHIAGLALVHDMWNFGGNDLGISSLRTTAMQKNMGWDDSIRFKGYWEIGDWLRMEGYVPEKVVCSVYYKPAGKDANGKPTRPWLMLVPMNDTDEDVTVTLHPNLKQLGLEALAGGRLRDVYRATSVTYDMKTLLNPGDPEPLYVVIDGSEEVFPMENGAARLTIPKRNFRALLLEERK